MTGGLVEKGWADLRSVIDPSISKEQFDAMRMAFFAGAQHLFMLFMTITSEGEEPTAEDEERLRLVHAELEAFRAEFEARLMPPPQGSCVGIDRDGEGV